MLEHLVHSINRCNSQRHSAHEWLALNGSKYTTSAEMKEAIEEYIEHFGVTDEEASVEDGDFMEIGSVERRGKNKGGKNK